MMGKQLIVLAALSLASMAQADMTNERRETLISFYPCGVTLNDSELSFLADWANAIKRDPCDMTAEEFAASFIDEKPAPAVEPIGHVRAYFTAENRSVLFVQQVLLMGRDEADGLWGPVTQARFASLLETYHAIGGINDDWGVRNQADVPRFLEWIGAAEYAQAVGGEFPD